MKVCLLTDGILSLFANSLRIVAILAAIAGRAVGESLGRRSHRGLHSRDAFELPHDSRLRHRAVDGAALWRDAR